MLLFFLVREFFGTLVFGIFLGLRVSHNLVVVFRQRRTQLEKHIIRLKFGLVILEVSFKSILTIYDVKFTWTLLLAIHKVSSVAKTIGCLQLANSINDTLFEVAGERAALRVEDLASAVGLMVHEFSLNEVAVAEHELPKAFSDI